MMQDQRPVIVLTGYQCVSFVNDEQAADFIAQAGRGLPCTPPGTSRPSASAWRWPAYCAQTFGWAGDRKITAYPRMRKVGFTTWILDKSSSVAT